MQYRLSHQFRIDPAGGFRAGLAAAPPSRSPADPAMAAAAAHYAAHRRDDAARACEAVLARQPDHVDALHLLGVVRTESGDPIGAYDPLLRAAGLAPDNARVHYHLGNAYLALQRFVEAAASFRRALACDPDLLDARNNLGNAERRQGHALAALDIYRAVLGQQPDFAPALFNMGVTLAGLGERAAAIDCYRAVLARPPGPDETARYRDVHEALVGAWMESACYAAAVDACRAWRALVADDWRADWHEALCRLALGQYAEAWPLYERRWELPEAREAQAPDARPPAVPTLGELAGKQVLLRGEQGRGDVIQFARYAPLLAHHAATVSLIVYPELKALLGRMPGLAAVYDDAEPEPAHDIAISLASLPLVFATTLETIPATVPYLAPTPAAVARWQARLGPPGTPNIGLCWWGSAHSRRSSIPPHLLDPLLHLPGPQFHILQRDIEPAHHAWIATHTRLTNHAADLTDFDETAALIAGLDLVITIDTSVAHLAGALGRPTWVLLRHGADWRWLCERTDSPWYPTTRLFRQGPDHEWEPVVATLRTALSALLGITRPARLCR